MNDTVQKWEPSGLLDSVDERNKERTAYILDRAYARIQNPSYFTSNTAEDIALSVIVKVCQMHSEHFNGEWLVGCITRCDPMISLYKRGAKFCDHEIEYVKSLCSANHGGILPTLESEIKNREPFSDCPADFFPTAELIDLLGESFAEYLSQ